MDISYYQTLNILANLIIARHYNSTRCVLVFSERNEQVFSYQGPMPAVHIEISKNSFDSDLVFQNHGCQDVIIQSEDPSLVFVELEKQIRLNMERFNRRRYLLLSAAGNNSNAFTTMVELNYVADFLVVVPNEEDFDLFTHEYGGTGVDDNNLVRLDMWIAANQSFVYDSDLYPDKISNQHGREFRMATLQYKPYSVIGDSVANYQGSELSTATHFALQHNMTPVPVVSDEGLWGEIFPNWTGNGILGNVVLDKADAGFGSLYTWESIYHYLDLSKPVVRAGVTCLVPAPKLAARWATPLLSYTPQLWICVAIVYCSGTMVFASMQYYHNRSNFLGDGRHQKRNSSSFMRVLGASALKIGRHFLLQAVGDYEIPPELSGRFMMLLMILFSLILTSTYMGGLSSIMTIPRYDHQIRTTDDFVRSGLSWGATHDVWITSIQEAEESKYVTLVSRFMAVPEEGLRQHALAGGFGFALERLPFNNFAIGPYIQKDVIGNYRLMHEDIYWEYSVMMLRKNSVLLPYLDVFILRVSETGLISKWQNTAVQLYMDSDVQKAVNIYSKHLLEHQVATLKLDQVEGAFVALFVGLLVSFVVLLCELLKNKCDYTLEFTTVSLKCHDNFGQADGENWLHQGSGQHEPAQEIMLDQNYIGTF